MKENPSIQSNPYPKYSVFRSLEGYALHPLDDGRPLAVELVCVAGVRLLLAVLQPAARVRLEHAVLLAEVAIAEAAVADDALGGVFALLEVAARLADGHFDVVVVVVVVVVHSHCQVGESLSVAIRTTETSDNGADKSEDGGGRRVEGRGSRWRGWRGWRVTARGA